MKRTKEHEAAIEAALKITNQYAEGEISRAKAKRELVALGGYPADVDEQLYIIDHMDDLERDGHFTDESGNPFLI